MTTSRGLSGNSQVLLDTSFKYEAIVTNSFSWIRRESPKIWEDLYGIIFRWVFLRSQVFRWFLILVAFCGYYNLLSTESYGLLASSSRVVQSHRQDYRHEPNSALGSDITIAWLVVL